MTRLREPRSSYVARAGWMLPALIAVLALADGAIHLSLDFLLFGGRLFGSLRSAGPPPGAAPGHGAPPLPGGGPLFQLPLPLNELFLLNFIGAVALVLVFWFGRRWLGRRRWLVDVAMIVYAIAAFVGWLDLGRPNPHNLGYLSKGIEIVLVIALAAHARRVLGRGGAGGRVA